MKIVCFGSGLRAKEFLENDCKYGNIECLLHESFPNCCTKEFPLIAEWRSDTYCLCDVYQTAISQGFGDVIPNNSDLQF